MFEVCWRSTAAAMVIGWAAAAAAAAAGPMHEKTPVKTLSASRSTYRMIQGDREVGKESVERTTYSDNTIEMKGSITMDPGPGLHTDQKVELRLEEESYFPRKLTSTKTITRGQESFEHTITMEMFANVAVISSKIREAASTRRVVVPAGIAVHDIGAVLYWYQTLFWYDRTLGGRQRFQWLNPVSGVVNSGEIALDREETLKVLGKKRKVLVYSAESEALGEATLYVDDKGLIVKCEQNMTIFELVQQSGK